MWFGVRIVHVLALIAVVFFSGAVGLLTPTESQAAPKDKNLNKIDQQAKQIDHLSPN